MLEIYKQKNQAYRKRCGGDVATNQGAERERERDVPHNGAASSTKRQVPGQLPQVRDGSRVVEVELRPAEGRLGDVPDAEGRHGCPCVAGAEVPTVDGRVVGLHLEVEGAELLVGVAGLDEDGGGEHGQETVEEGGLHGSFDDDAGWRYG